MSLIDQRLLDQIRLLNREPLNQVAASFLAPKDRLWNQLAVITLMRWGLDNGLQTRPLGPTHPDQFEVEQTLLTMDEVMAPAQAMEFLVNPEGLEGEAGLFAEDLQSAESPLEAAQILLEQLVGAIVVTRP